LTTLTVIGELDLLASPALERELERAYASDGDLILLDLTRVEFMDSTGLHLLVKARRRAEQDGRTLALTKGGEQVQRLLDLTGVADLVRIVESPEDLLEPHRASDGP
jgi:anti-sigma B factor antagonist